METEYAECFENGEGGIRIMKTTGYEYRHLFGNKYLRIGGGGPKRAPDEIVFLQKDGRYLTYEEQSKEPGNRTVEVENER